jgi:hypothetical protein
MFEKGTTPEVPVLRGFLAYYVLLCIGSRLWG